MGNVFLLYNSLSSPAICVATAHDKAEASYRELTQCSISVVARVRWASGKKRGESKISSRSQLSPLIAHTSGVSSLFSRSRSRRLSGHRLAFQTLSFSGPARYLTSRLLSATALYNHDQFTSAVNCRDVRRGRLRSPCGDRFGERIIPTIFRR